MRKQKSVVAILLAVMMIFTFMPTMSFAAENAKASEGTWDLVNKTVTVNGDTYAGVRVYFDYGRNGTGIVTAVAPTDAHINNWTFFDLDYAEIITVDGSQVPANASLEVYTALNEKPIRLKFNEPEYVTNYDKSHVAYGVPTDWSLTSKVVELEAASTTQKGSVSAVWKVVPGTTTPAELKGTLKAKEVLVQSNKNMQVVRDDNKAEVVNGSKQVVEYSSDKTVNFTAKEVNGYGISYAKFNDSTAKWDAVNGIAIKNKADEGIYKAVYTKNNVESAITFTVSVTAMAAPTYEFDHTAIDNIHYYVRNTIDPSSFIKVNGILDSDKEAAMKYFNEAYEIKVTENAGDANVKTWTISPKKDVKASKLFEDNTVFCMNYGQTKATATKVFELGTQKSETVEVYSASNNKDDDITFSGVTTKSFKAKKKTKKLASTKTFKVAAAADSGNEITFTGTSSNAKVSIDATGKVTVKKGLKKGTKVTLVVKAKTAAGNGYKAWNASKTYTIKVK